MKNTPGIAAQVFNAISATDADIRLITTSEVEISLLVTERILTRCWLPFKLPWLDVTAPIEHNEREPLCGTPFFHCFF